MRKTAACHSQVTFDRPKLRQMLHSQLLPLPAGSLHSHKDQCVVLLPSTLTPPHLFQTDRNWRPISYTRSMPPTTSIFRYSSGAIRMYRCMLRSLWKVTKGRAVAPPEGGRCEEGGG